MKHSCDIEAVELPLLIEGVLHWYGFDLSGYRSDFLRRKIRGEMKKLGLPTVSRLQEQLLHSAEAFDRFLGRLSSAQSHTVDKAFVRVLSESVLPHLRTYPSIRVWQVGGSLRELYTLAGLFDDAGLSERTTVYYTDVSQAMVRKAEFGARLRKRPKTKIAFFQHNLSTDASFNEFHVILCRNLLRHLTPAHRNRVLELFEQSLCALGILGLGRGDGPLGVDWESAHERIAQGKSFFRKVASTRRRVNG